jgi:nitric oxide reductase large subunit
VVDVSALYGMAERRATRSVLESKAPPTPEAVGSAIGSLVRTTDEFGTQLEAVLRVLAQECDCTLVAMAAVFGSTSQTPDYTAEVARRLGMEAAP